MRRLLETAPLIRSIYWKTIGRIRLKRDARRWANMNAKAVFTEIYETNQWSDGDSCSGTGSNLSQTREIRDKLPALLGKHGVHSMADVPCGDFFWLSQVDLTGVRYTGGDIVAQLIEKNRTRYQRPDTEFRVLDLLQDELPAVDLLLVRDCLVHFSFADIFRALGNIARSKTTYLLTTTFRDVEQNTDIVTGRWRMVNFEQPPFSFPQPLDLISENCTESRLAASKCLALWRVADLAGSITKSTSRASRP